MNKSLLTNLLSVLLVVIGYFSPLYSEEIFNMGLFSFSGAITNWLAIHMLFEKVPGLYGSGIVTEKFQEFKIGIEKLLMNQFFTKENIEKFLNSEEKKLIQIDKEKVIESIDFENVFTKLKSAILESQFGSMLSMFGGEQALEPLKPQFQEKFNEIISDILSDERLIHNLIHSDSNLEIDFSQNILTVVKERLNELTPEMVKEIIQEMIREHLGWLVVWGGVFGALIGLITSISL